MVVVAPELANPAFDAALLSFLILCGCIAAAGIIYILHGFTRATVGGIAGLLGHIPGVGFIIASPVNAVYHWMNAEFSAAEAGLDRRISLYFHQLAKLFEWVGKEIQAHANLLWLLSTILLGSTQTQLLKGLVRLARHEIDVLRGSVAALAHSIVKPIQGELKALERWTYPRVRAAEHAIDVTIPRDIAGLRARTKTIEGELSNAWDYLRSHPWTVVTDAFVGAVAIAITRLGLDWIKCDAAKAFHRKRGCNGWNDLDALLALAVTAIAVEDLRTIVKGLQLIEAEAVKGIEIVLHA